MIKLQLPTKNARAVLGIFDSILQIDIIALVVLVIIGIIIIMLIRFLLMLIPAVLLAALIWFFTGSLL
jgi:fatty acid desaturase